jgi:hypothetical protein
MNGFTADIIVIEGGNRSMQVKKLSGGSIMPAA